MKRKALIIIAVTFILLVPLIPSSLGIFELPETHTLEEQKPNRDNSISSEGWLTGFIFRKSLNITGSIGAGTDYQLMFEVHYDDAAEILTLGGNCQSDFDDIRFTDNDGVTELDYWLEEYTGSDDATFWVEVADDLDSDQQIYIYYGNGEVSTTSNGDNTFIFFDDFENDDLDRWDTAEGNWETTDDEKRYGNYSVFGDADATGRILNKEYSPALTGDFMAHVWARFEIETGTFPVYGWDDGDDDVYFLASNEDDFATYNGVSWVTYDTSTAIDDTWIRIEIAVDNTNSLFRFWHDRIAGSDTRPNKDGTGSTITGITDIGSITATAEGRDTWLDDYYIRNWVFVEPSHSFWGDEEERDREWYSFTMEQIEFDLPGWYGFTMEDIAFYIPFGVTNVPFMLMLGGLIMIPASTLLLVKGGRSDMSRDKLFLFLIMFLFGWALFLGGVL